MNEREQLIADLKEVSSDLVVSGRGRLAGYVDRAIAAIERAAELEKSIAGKYAKIDALMLGYCPDEMTSEQTEEWGKRQVRVSPERTAEITTALAQGKSHE